MRIGRSGFTLIELLVVIAILAMLIGILVPVLGSARATARATVSLSNTRQWALGVQHFVNENKDWLPWDGEKNPTDMDKNFASDKWWANAVPPMVGQPAYRDFAAAGRPIPMPPDKTIFTDPGTRVPVAAQPSGYVGGGGNKFFFCYVFNANINNNVAKLPDGTKSFKLTNAAQPSALAIMLEMRTVPEELPASDPFFGATLDRQKSDWQRFAARHRKGGHIAFGDAHAAWYSNPYAATPQVINGLDDWNKPDLVWDPFGAAR